MDELRAQCQLTTHGVFTDCKEHQNVDGKDDNDAAKQGTLNLNGAGLHSKQENNAVEALKKGKLNVIGAGLHLKQEHEDAKHAEAVDEVLKEEKLNVNGAEQENDTAEDIYGEDEAEEVSKILNKICSKIPKDKHVQEKEKTNAELLIRVCENSRRWAEPEDVENSNIDDIIEALNTSIDGAGLHLAAKHVETDDEVLKKDKLKVNGARQDLKLENKSAVHDARKDEAEKLHVGKIKVSEILNMICSKIPNDKLVQQRKRSNAKLMIRVWENSRRWAEPEDVENANIDDIIKALNTSTDGYNAKLRELEKIEKMCERYLIKAVILWRSRRKEEIATQKLLELWKIFN